VLAGPMIATLFLSDRFDLHDVFMARQSLMAYSVGLLGFILIKVLAPGYYARQDTRTPVKVGIIAMVVNMAFNLALIFPLQHAGLALATSLSAFVNAGLLYHGLRKTGVYRPSSGWPLLWLRIGVASTIMAGVIVLLAPGLAQWAHWGVWPRTVPWTFSTTEVENAVSHFLHFQWLTAIENGGTYRTLGVEKRCFSTPC